MLCHVLPPIKLKLIPGLQDTSTISVQASQLICSDSTPPFSFLPKPEPCYMLITSTNFKSLKVQDSLHHIPDKRHTATIHCNSFDMNNFHQQFDTFQLPQKPSHEPMTLISIQLNFSSHHVHPFDTSSKQPYLGRF
ncbi:hypothetical protein Droror1_Dr00027720 [Drosera rotundifolia]